MVGRLLSINPRSSWNAKPPRSFSEASLTRGIIFHWNGPPKGEYSEIEVPNIVKDTQNFHMDTQGWNDIAYNYAIDRFGGVWEGRGLDIWNAASGTTFANSNLLAVELILGEGDVFSQAAKDAMIQIARWYTITLNRTPKFYGHKDIVATSCPGDEIYAFIQTLPTLLPEEKKEDMASIVVSDNGTVYIVDSTKTPIRSLGTWAETESAIRVLITAKVVSSYVSLPQKVLDIIPDALSAEGIALEVFNKLPTAQTGGPTLQQIEDVVVYVINSTSLKV